MFSRFKKLCDCHMLYPLSQCAPSASFHIFLLQDVDYKIGLTGSGFVCHNCNTGYANDSRCANCSLCVAGTYSDMHGSCEMCPAGNCENIDKKQHSNGTLLPEKLSSYLL